MLSVCACLSRQYLVRITVIKSEVKISSYNQSCQPVRQMKNLIQKQMNYYTNII
jgi:hypothetical protein